MNRGQIRQLNRPADLPHQNQVADEFGANVQEIHDENVAYLLPASDEIGAED
jgi:hypothetical protein